MNKDGVLETYLSERPNQRRKFKFLDKRTAAAKAAPAPEAVAAPAREIPAASAPEPATPIEDPKIEAALEAGTVESA
ncbi:MAG: hypothetical protein C4320_05905 [Armatimonadota bacterium]